MDNVLAAAGTSAAKVGEPALENAGVIYHGLTILGEGAVLAGLMLGAIVAFIIDKNSSRRRSRRPSPPRSHSSA